MATSVHCDYLYGNITLSPPVVSNIVKTALFQRLKHVSQLGVMLFTNPSANYSRYEHSIGTFHRTREMLNALEHNSGSQCPMTHAECWPSYRLAVEIAALLHDIGHGPLSHSWEYVVSNFHHEHNGIACIDAIFNELPEMPKEFQTADPQYWIALIKSLIVGEIPSSLPDEYKFIFEIMNNYRCGVDVDKWDYLLRDKRYLNNVCIPLNFQDLFLKARIAADGSCIEYRYCDYSLISDLFFARQLMHIHFYRTPINEICEEILVNVVNQCNETLCGLKLNAITSANLSAFLQLTDDKVLDMIKCEKAYKYLKYCNCIEITEVDNNACIPNNEEAEKLTADLNIKKYKTIIVPNIMPAEVKFNFYGNESEKPKIERKNIAYTKTFLFTLPSSVCNES